MTTQHSSTSKPRVVVIGAGIVGSVLAFNLSRRNVELTVIDHAQPGSGASSHSFAWLNAFGKEPVAYYDLNRRSMNMWDRLCRRLNADIGLRWGGEITWVASDAHARALEERVRTLQSRGYPSRLIDEDELRRLEPGLIVDRFVAGEYSDNDGHVDPHKVVAACLSHVRSAGGTVNTNTAVSGFTLNEKGHISAVQTPSGVIPCDTVVLSAGLGATRLAALLGVEVAQQESPGVVGRTTPVQPVFHTTSILHVPALDDKRDKIHIRQYSDGTLMIGEGSQESESSDDSQAHAEYMLARAMHHLPALKGAKITPVPVGYRPMPMDGLPVLGFTDEVPNLYITVMHSGVTLAAAVGEFATIEIVDGVSVDILEAYRLRRFSLVG